MCETLSGLFSSNLIDQLSYRILTTQAKTRTIFHDDWSIRLGENRPDRTLTHLAAMLDMVHHHKQDLSVYQVIMCMDL